MPSSQGDKEFVRLCSTLITSAIHEKGADFTVPNWTERGSVPDQGVDLEYCAPTSWPEAGGLVGPGRNVYQIKRRTVGPRPARNVIHDLRHALTGALRGLVARQGSLPDRYVLLVNLDLARHDRTSLTTALLDGCPEVSDHPLIIWGAAEIAAALNTHPDLRYCFFSEGTFCTLDVARAELRAAYRVLGWPAEFVGRKEALQSIRDFEASATDRLLLVTGLPYSGTTRTVIEALSQIRASVAWSSDPDSVSEGHLRQLDLAMKPAVLVVDRCDADHIERLEPWARSRTHLKTILISRQSPFIPGASVVQLEPLSDSDSFILCRQLAEGLPLLLYDWVARIAGNLPGLLIHAFAAFRATGGQPPTLPETDQPQEGLARLLREPLLRNLTLEQQKALGLLAILPQVGIGGDAAEELETLCDIFGVDNLTVRQAIPTFQERHLLLPRGRFVEVIPELLAAELAADALDTKGTIVPALWLRLSPLAQDRLVRRLTNLSHKPSVQRFIEDILSLTGWFPSLDALREHPRRFRILAQARPRASLQLLQQLLRNQDVPALRETLAGEFRREIVWTLEALAGEAPTFSGAVDLLFRLAESEDESTGNNATEVLRSLFHWNHPDITVPGVVRIETIRQAAQAASPTRRKLAVQAAAGSIPWDTAFLVRPTDTMVPPNQPGRPRTRVELFAFCEQIVSILTECSRDCDEGVRGTAISEILPTIREVLRFLVYEDEVPRLAKACIDTLEQLATANLAVTQQAGLRKTLALTQWDLAERIREAAKATVPTSGLVKTKDQLAKVQGLLLVPSFEGRLKRSAGPRVYGDDRLEFRESRRVGPTTMTTNLGALAAEACEDPTLLSDALIDWLLTPEASRSGVFFVELGTQYFKRSWLRPILDRLHHPGGPEVFGCYLVGISKADPDAVDGALDQLSVEHEAHRNALLSALVALPASPKTSERLIALVRRGAVPVTRVLEAIPYGWVRHLSPASFERLLGSLDDGSSGAARGRVRLFETWIEFENPRTEELVVLAWSALRRSAATEDFDFADTWDAIATWLTESGPRGFLDLLKELFADASSAPLTTVLDHLAYGRVWRTLQPHARQDFIRALLQMQVGSGHQPHWVPRRLRKMLDFKADEELLLDFVAQHGEQGALAVADALDADHDGFWSLVARLLATYPESDRLADRLHSRVGSTGAVTGSLIPKWHRRREKAAELRDNPHAGIRHWAVQQVDWLSDLIRSQEEDEQEGFIWDYGLSRRELRAMVEKQDSPDRRWALRRILRRAPTKDVLDLLTLQDIQEGLSVANLPEPKRRDWEAYLAHWMRHPRE